MTDNPRQYSYPIKNLLLALDVGGSWSGLVADLAGDTFHDSRTQKCKITLTISILINTKCNKRIDRWMGDPPITAFRFGPLSIQKQTQRLIN